MIEVMDRTESTLRKETKEALCYIPFFGWIPGVAFFLLEKDKQIRWNAVQSIILHLVVAGLYMVVVPILNLTIILAPLAWTVQGLAGVAFLLLMLYVMAKAYQGEIFRVPLVAEWTDKAVKKLKVE